VASFWATLLLCASRLTACTLTAWRLPAALAVTWLGPARQQMWLLI
jgi:hypothetical protein